jgi:uncharacterized damage-inducible protein DinB
MNVIELFAAELDREAERCKRVLKEVPEGKRDWKPHDRSMQLGYLADLVTTMFSWVSMVVNQDEIDIAPVGGSTYKAPTLETYADRLAALEKSLTDAKAALRSTSEAHLETNWRILAGGKLAAEQPRHIVIRETVNHLSHHRGQLTVYLRLLGAKVPSVYGPSADDKSFG